MLVINEVITNPSLINHESWSEFVRSHPDGNIFQTPEYFNLCQSSPCEGIIICSIAEERINGIFVAHILRDYKGFAGKITARSVATGGPLVKDNNPEIAEFLIRTFVKKVRRDLLFSQIRNLSDISFCSDLLNSVGYKFENHINFIIDLDKTREELWTGLHQVRRKQIKRSQNRGVHVKVCGKIEDETLVSCYEMLKKTYLKRGLPLPGTVFFRKATEILAEKGILKLFIAECLQEIIAFRMVLCYKNVIYDWYAASSDMHTDKYPNDLLPWEIFLWGSQNGYNIFDFGGAGRPDRPYGVRDFKQKFGGKLVSFGRYTLIHKKLQYHIVMMMFMLHRKIRSIL